jgi:hypothetical protein
MVSLGLKYIVVHLLSCCIYRLDVSFKDCFLLEIVPAFRKLHIYTRCHLLNCNFGTWSPIMFTTQILYIIVIFVVPFICFIHFFNLIATYGHSPSIFIWMGIYKCIFNLFLVRKYSRKPVWMSKRLKRRN